MEKELEDNMRHFPFKGIVLWGGINLHTDMVYRELAKYVDVMLCTMRLGFREYGDIDLGNIKVRTIKSVDDFPKDTISDDYLHIVGAPKYVKTYNGPIYDCSVYAIKHGCHVMALNIEQYQWWFGVKGWLRRLKWFWTYNFGAWSKVKAIGCQGESGVLSYRKCLVGKRRLFEYIYSPPRIAFTPPQNVLDSIDNEKFQFTFVGRINPRKCIIPLARTLHETDWNFQLNIAGCGELESELHTIIDGDSRFNFLGSRQPEQIHGLLETTDCLILPSSFDGWGAVVNEGLLHGCRCIVSDAAGAHDLIRYTGYGAAYQSGNWAMLKDVAGRELSRGKLSEKERNEIKAYSQNIEPTTVANYLVQVVNYYFGEQDKKPNAPWK